MVEIFTSGRTNVHMSADSAEHYGAFANEFPRWAETQGVKDVIIVTPEDILGEQSISDLQGISEAEALTDQYMQKNHPELYEHLATDNLYINDIRQMAVTGAARAMAIDVDGDGINDIGVVVTPNKNATSQDISRDTSGYRELSTPNPLRTDLERQVAVIAHEIGHLDHANSRNPITSFEAERNAESDMVDFMTDAHSRGLISNPDAIGEHTLSRSLGVFFHQSSNSHDLGPSVQLPHEDGAPFDVSNNEYWDALNSAKEKVFSEAGESMRGDIETYIVDEQELPSFSDLSREDISVLRDLRQGNIGQEEALSSLSEETAEIFNDRLVLKAMQNREISFSEGSEQLSEDLRESINTQIETKVALEGHRLLQGDPELMYRTVSDLDDQGAFGGNPLEQQYATEFLDATRRLAPEQFGVDIDHGGLQQLDVEGNFIGPDAAAEGDEGLIRQAEGAGFQTNLPLEVDVAQSMQGQQQTQTYAQNSLG